MKKLLLLGALAVGLSGSAFAVNFSLTDGNAFVQGNDITGLTGWTTDGINDLYNQDYFYRIGNTSGEARVGTLGTAVISQTAANAVNIAWTTTFLRFDISFTLYGGATGSGTADLGEIVRVTNLTNSALDFHLFEYDDFDMNGTAGGDTASALNFFTIGQSDGGRSVQVGTTPAPNSWQIAGWPILLNSLNNGTPTNLNNTGSGSGPDDLAFAMQWNRNIAAGGSFIMSKDKLIQTVPEPTTMAALGLGLVATLRRRNKK